MTCLLSDLLLSHIQIREKLSIHIFLSSHFLFLRDRFRSHKDEQATITEFKTCLLFNIVMS